MQDKARNASGSARYLLHASATMMLGSAWKTPSKRKGNSFH
jgi:hypothetical protein